MNEHDLKIVRNAKHGKLEGIRYIIKINGITDMITDDIAQFKDRLDWALWGVDLIEVKTEITYERNYK